MAKKKLVCICNSVAEKEIITLLKKGARTLSDIQTHTAAGTGCGRCRNEINNLITEHLKTLKPDPQRKIDF